MIRVLIALVTLLCLAPAAVASAQTPPRLRLSRVRTVDDDTARLVVAGLDRSAIIRRLVADIEVARVIVFVGLEREMPERLAGRMTLLGAAGKYRYLRIFLNRELPMSAGIATLAHELQHVREVIAHPDVRDVAGLAELYRRIGHESEIAGKIALDTDAAQQMGYAVRREIGMRR